MEVYDKDGNLVEGVMTQAEVDAKLAEAQTAWEAANKVTPPAPVTPPAANADEPPAWAKALISTVETLSGNQKQVVIKDIVQTLEADKQPVFNAKYEALTGYPETPEGMQQRAQDAYLLTTGQRYDVTSINMNNIVASTGGPVRPAAPTGEVTKAFQETFNISDDDVKKYGPK